MFPKVPETEQEYYDWEVGCDPDHPYFPPGSLIDMVKDRDGLVYLISVIVYLLVLAGTVVLELLHVTG